MRLLARPALTEKRERAEACLFGRHKHVSARAGTALKNGTLPLLNPPKARTGRLTEAYLAALQARSDALDFLSAMGQSGTSGPGTPVSPRSRRGRCGGLGGGERPVRLHGVAR